MITVSVLMPAYNAEKHIGEAINSILNQSYSDWELLILNDASSDNTGQVVSRYSDKRIQVFQNEKNLGYLKSCNRLFGLAKGDFITFLDADDICQSQRLEKCISKLEDSGSDFLTTDHTRFWENGKEQLYQQPIDFNRLASDSSYYPMLCGATVFAKRELIDKVGGYHQVFVGMGAEDYHWIFRLSRAGKGAHAAEPLYKYRQHSGQIRHRSEPENFIAHDFDKAIRKTLLTDEIDLLIPENSKKLDAVKRKLLQPFEADRTLILRYRSIQLLNSATPSKAISTALNAVSLSPSRMANWQNLVYTAYVAMRRSVGI